MPRRSGGVTDWSLRAFAMAARAAADWADCLQDATATRPTTPHRLPAAEIESIRKNFNEALARLMQLIAARKAKP